MRKINRSYRQLIKGSLAETGQASLYQRIDGLSRPAARLALMAMADELGIAPADLEFARPSDGITTLRIKDQAARA